MAAGGLAEGGEGEFIWNLPAIAWAPLALFADKPGLYTPPHFPAIAARPLLPR